MDLFNGLAIKKGYYNLLDRKKAANLYLFGNNNWHTGAYWLEGNSLIVPDSRRTKGSIAALRDPLCNNQAGAKDKQDWMIIYFPGPKSRQIKIQGEKRHNE
ncbi:MAG: hypothetical protein P8163_04625 [Candidatus Thiodiazotropha sp.]